MTGSRRILVIAAAAILVAGAVAAFVVLRGRATPAERGARRLLERLEGGEAEAVYAEAAGPLRGEQSGVDFAAYLAERRALLGALVKVGRARRIESGVAGGVAFRFELSYERGDTTGEITVLDSDGDWRLARYRVPLPAALMPGPDNPVPPPPPPPPPVADAGAPPTE